MTTQINIDVETVSPVQKRVAIEVPWTRVKQELDAAYRGLAKRAQVKGFRAGKVPRKVLEKMYRRAVEGEVINRLLDETFQEAVDKEDLFPIDRPVVDETLEIQADAPFKFVATVDVKPHLNVEHYKALDVVKKVREVSDEEVARELAALRDKATLIEQVSGRDVAESGDLAVIDFFGYVDGETFKGGKGINYTVELGSGQMIAGFEDLIVGMKIGEQKEFQLNFPKGEGPDEVKGKDVEWKVDLKELKRKILPDLDDEFAKDLGDYESLDELKDNLRKNLRTREDARGKKDLRESAMKVLVEKNPTDVPGVMIERQLDFLLSEVNQIAQQTKDPKMLEAIAKLRDENRDRAREQVAGMLLLEAVARQEELEVTDAELDGRLSDIARDNRMNVKQVRAQLKKEGRLEAVRYDMLQDRALDLVVDEASVTEEVVEDDGSGDDHAHDHDHDHDH